MRPTSELWPKTMTTSHPTTVEVRSVYDGTVGATVPIIAGQLTFDSTAQTQRRCTITVPLYGPDGFRWDPGSDPLHPLATYGQRLRIRLGIRHPDGTGELLPQGLYLISSVSTDEIDGIVTVQGSDLMTLMTESKIVLASDSVLPLDTDTQLTALQKMTYPALHSPTLGDVAILPTRSDTLPISTLGGTVAIRDGADRIEIMNRILEAWPARMYVDDDGYIHFASPIEGPKAVPDVTVTGNYNGSTMVSRGRTQDRRRAYNAVVVSGRRSDTGAISGRARVMVQTGPMGVRGPYGWITRWYQTDLVSSTPHALAVAGNLLRKGTLFGRTERVVCVPDARIEIGDTVRAISTAAGTFTGLCASVVIPLTAADGPMTLDITSVPDEASILKEGL